MAGGRPGATYAVAVRPGRGGRASFGGLGPPCDLRSVALLCPLTVTNSLLPALQCLVHMALAA